MQSMITSEGEVSTALRLVKRLIAAEQLSQMRFLVLLRFCDAPVVLFIHFNALVRLLLAN
jgi:hypothetical protein